MRRLCHTLRPLHRFVFCRQRQDSRLKRGGEQKSLVLLAPQPWSSVLSQVSQWAGQLYFNQGSAALPQVIASSNLFIDENSLFDHVHWPECRKIMLAALSFLITATALPWQSCFVLLGSRGEALCDRECSLSAAEIDAHMPLICALT